MPINSPCLTLVTLFGAATLVDAADVSHYGVVKLQSYLQTSVAAPALKTGNAYSFRAVVAPTGADLVESASFQTPAGGGGVLSDSGEIFIFTNAFSSLASLNSTYPSGSYTMLIDSANDSFNFAMLDLTGDNYPTAAPRISNYVAAQAVNSSNSFAVNWAAFSGGTANDLIQLIVQDDALGATVFQTPALTETGALNGTATSASIPANILDAGKTYTAVLLFLRLTDSDASSYPGALGFAGYGRDTSFTLKTTGSSTPDTTPPSLLFSSPTNNAPTVSVSAPIIFTFSERMTPTQSIAWSANVAPSAFVYTWTTSNRVLVCTYNGTLPANSTITWVLNPSAVAPAFRDITGNALPPDAYAGSFTTGEGSGGSATGSYLLFKSLNYYQDSPDIPMLEGGGSATFGASLFSPTNNPVTQATLVSPDGSTRRFTNFIGNAFLISGIFDQQTNLDAANPAGNYTMNISRFDGATQSVVLSLPDNYPPIPQLSNYGETLMINPAAPLTLRWNNFTGATPNDAIIIEIQDEDGDVVFEAPTTLNPLASTATSITIPANTFKAGTNYEASLTFTRITDRTNTVPDIPGTALLTRITYFALNAGEGGGVTPPRFTQFIKVPDGSFQVQLSVQPSVTYLLEASTAFTNWTTLLTTNAAAGIIVFTDTGAAGLSRRFYRARTGP